MKLYHELKIVLQAMNEADIPTIVLKGAHLAALVYPDISMRPMGDIDLMVPVERLEEGARVLEGLGYRASLGYEIETILKLRHHLPPFVKSGERAIELHWNISVPTNPFEIDLEEVWKRAKVVQIANCETHVLSPEDLLLHLSMHGIYQHKLAFRLRSIYDIKKVVDVYGYEISWEVALDRAALWKCAKPFLVSLQVLEDLIGVKSVDKLDGYDFANKDDLALQAEKFLLDYPEPIHETIVEYAEKKSIVDKMVHVLRRIFISREEMALKYGADLNSPRRYYYFIVRAFELFKKYREIIVEINNLEETRIRIVKENQDLADLKKSFKSDSEYKGIL